MRQNKKRAAENGRENARLGDLNLLDVAARNLRRELRERLAAGTADADEEAVATGHGEDACNACDVLRSEAEEH